MPLLNEELRGRCRNSFIHSVPPFPGKMCHPMFLFFSPSICSLSSILSHQNALRSVAERAVDKHRNMMRMAGFPSFVEKEAVAKENGENGDKNK